MPGLRRPRAVELYIGAIRNLRRCVETDGPFDVSVEKAKRFRTVYETQSYSKGKPKSVEGGDREEDYAAVRYFALAAVSPKATAGP